MNIAAYNEGWRNGYLDLKHLGLCLTVTQFAAYGNGSSAQGYQDGSAQAQHERRDER